MKSLRFAFIIIIIIMIIIINQFVTRQVPVSQILRPDLFEHKNVAGDKCFKTAVFMVAICNTADHYIFALSFLSIFFFPRLISAVGDWVFTIFPHTVCPSCEFRMHV